MSMKNSQVPTQQIDNASDILHYDHDVRSMDTTKIGAHLETNIENAKSPEDNIDNRSNDQRDTMED